MNNSHQTFSTLSSKYTACYQVVTSYLTTISFKRISFLNTPGRDNVYVKWLTFSFHLLLLYFLVYCVILLILRQEAGGSVLPTTVKPSGLTCLNSSLRYIQILLSQPPVVLGLHLKLSTAMLWVDLFLIFYLFLGGREMGHSIYVTRYSPPGRLDSCLFYRWEYNSPTKIRQTLNLGQVLPIPLFVLFLCLPQTRLVLSLWGILVASWWGPGLVFLVRWWWTPVEQEILSITFWSRIPLFYFRPCQKEWTYLAGTYCQEMIIQSRLWDYHSSILCQRTPIWENLARLTVRPNHLTQL